MAQAADMDTTTHIPITSTSTSPRSSPSLERLKEEEEGGAYSDLKTSLLNGSAAPADCRVQPSREALGKNSPALSPCQKAAVKKEEEEEEEEEDSPQLVVHIKQEQELDAPLDFSIKRKDSGADSFRERHTPTTTPSFFSTWHCPRPFVSSPPSSSRLSPDTSLQQPAVPGSQQHNNYNNGGSSREGWDGEEHSRSPSPSQPPSAAAKLSSGSAALGALSEEPGAINPAALSAVLAQKGALTQGALTTVPGLLEEARKLQAASGVGGGKVQRPFKAYPKEVLRMPLGYLGLPGVSPFPSMDAGFVQGLTVLPEDLMTVYQQQAEALKEREKQLRNAAGKRTSRSPPPPSSLSPAPSNGRGPSAAHTTPPPPPSAAGHSLPLLQSSAPSTHSDSPSPGPSAGSRASPSPPARAHTPSSDSAPSTLPSSAAAAPLVSSTSSGGSRKRPRNMPDTEKDDAYWERRRKNNDAAKRSRDARRAKEDEIALRAALLEQENLRLRVEVATLKTETARLRCLLYKT